MTAAKRIKTALLVFSLLSNTFALAETVTVNGAAGRVIHFHSTYADNPVVAGESSAR